MERKQIRSSTYYRHGKFLAEICGPWSPGGVWMLEIYVTLPPFEEAWRAGTITAVERKRVSPELNAIASAMSFGRSNAPDPEIAKWHANLGYRYPRKRDAVEALMHWWGLSPEGK